MTDYLKKTLCDLIDQKKDILASFLESPDFNNLIEKYRKSLDSVLRSKDSSVKYLRANSAILKNTLKDTMIYNILNIKNLENDEILNQKIKNFTQTLQKEFNKNKLYLHGILSTITSDIIYQANIALFNSLRECLRDDFNLLDKLVDCNITMGNISNFQQNHIQGGFLFQQVQIKNKLNNLDISDDNTNSEIFPNTSHILSETYFASIIGLKTEFHNENKLKVVLEKQFNCRASILNKKDEYLGVQIFFNSAELLHNFMKKKYHEFKVDDKFIKLSKKPHKSGNRFYVKYNENNY